MFSRHFLAILAALILPACAVHGGPVVEDEPTASRCQMLCSQQAWVCGWDADEEESCVDLWADEPLATFRCDDLLDFPANCEDPMTPGTEGA